MEKRIIVAADGSGDFKSVQEAVDAVGAFQADRTIIYIKKGVYNEKITIPSFRQRISFIGESAESTILTYSDCAKTIGLDGKELGTFGSATVTVYADFFYAEKLTIANTAGMNAGQAVALHAETDRSVLNQVRLLGHQDTLYISRGRQYFKDCYIEGTVDYIFGSATTVFEDCQIHQLQRGGYITASSSPQENEYGFVFLNCRLTGDAPEESVYLGRPWRPYAAVAFVNTWMGSHIHPAGWHNWGEPSRENTSRYAEYGCNGPGYKPDQRVTWAKHSLKAGEGLWTVTNILSGADGWNPLLLIEQ